MNLKTCLFLFLLGFLISCSSTENKQDEKDKHYLYPDHIRGF